MEYILEPDFGQIEKFADLIFRHVTNGYVSLRSFRDDNTVFNIEAVEINGSGLKPVCDAAGDRARRAANAKEVVVFAPPVAVFKNSKEARQDDLLAGPALSIDCDKYPERSKAELEAILGPATVAVHSGGEWVDPETGEIENKVHLHWRLAVPAVGEEALNKLKTARRLANAVVDGDTTNDPVSHPLRWPGSWHRKGEPRLCSIVSTTESEINIDEVLPLLEQAPKRRAARSNNSTGSQRSNEDGRAGWSECVSNIIVGIGLHENIAKMAAKMVAAGYNDGAAVEILRGVMDASSAKTDFLRWSSRRDDIPRAVSTAREKYGRPEEGAVTPIDLWAKLEPPTLPRGVLPLIIEEFAFAQGELMGADPAGLAMGALCVCAAAIPDSVEIQVKQHDPSWREAARLWVAEIGDPSTKKSPVLRQVARPLVRLDGELAKKYLAEKARYDNLPAEERKSINPPKKKRMRIEDTTIEAAQEILKDSPQGVLSLQDELTGWFGSMDKYSGGRGAQKDRGFWLQAYNGGQYVSDRVGRGMCHIPNLSISLLGGIQPGPLRKIIDDTVDDGLIQRLLPVMLRPAMVGKDEERGAAVSAYEKLIEKLAGKQALGGMYEPSPLTVHFSAEAQAIRQRLERKHIDLMTCEGLSPKLAAHLGKYDGIFARLCLVWHCIEADRMDPVSEEIAKRVEKFLHLFLLPHAVAFYGGALQGDDHSRLADVAGYILAHKLSVITNRDLARCVRSTKGLSKAETASVFERLDALGWISQVPGPRVMSPPQWVVNPECHRLYAARGEKEVERRAKAREVMQEIFAELRK
jgi:Protein of unknown function (DUF3987)